MRWECFLCLLLLLLSFFFLPFLIEFNFDVVVKRGSFIKFISGNLNVYFSNVPRLLMQFYENVFSLSFQIFFRSIVIIVTLLITCK